MKFKMSRQKTIEGSFCSLQRLEKDPKKITNFQYSELYITSRAQIVKNKACKMLKSVAKLSKFPLEFSLEACYVLGNISNMRCSVSSSDETPRRELKI